MRLQPGDDPTGIQVNVPHKEDIEHNDHHQEIRLKDEEKQISAGRDQTEGDREALLVGGHHNAGNTPALGDQAACVKEDQHKEEIEEDVNSEGPDQGISVPGLEVPMEEGNHQGNHLDEEDQAEEIMEQDIVLEREGKKK